MLCKEDAMEPGHSAIVKRLLEDVLYQVGQGDKGDRDVRCGGA